MQRTFTGFTGFMQDMSQVKANDAGWLEIDGDYVRYPRIKTERGTYTETYHAQAGAGLVAKVQVR